MNNLGVIFFSGWFAVIRHLHKEKAHLESLMFVYGWLLFALKILLMDNNKLILLIKICLFDHVLQAC